MGCHLSSKLARASSPFPHWKAHDLSALGERSITASLHLGHHCQIEGLGRSHFTRGKHLHSATSKVQTASSPQSRWGAKHPLALCLFRETVWILECGQGGRTWAGGSWECFLSHCKHSSMEAVHFYHFTCNSGESGQSRANRWGQEILALRRIPCSQQKILYNVFRLQRVF